MQVILFRKMVVEFLEEFFTSCFESCLKCFEKCLGLVANISVLAFVAHTPVQIGVGDIKGFKMTNGNPAIHPFEFVTLFSFLIPGMGFFTACEQVGATIDDDLDGAVFAKREFIEKFTVTHAINHFEVFIIEMAFECVHQLGQSRVACQFGSLVMSKPDGHPVPQTAQGTNLFFAQGMGFGEKLGVGVA